MPALIDQLGKFTKLNVPLEMSVVVTLVVGALLLFLGLKIFRLWLGITGLAAGAYVGILLVNLLKPVPPTNWIVLGLMAAAGAFALALAYKLCFFIGGFVGGVYFGQYLLAIFYPGGQQYLVLLAGLACALVALFLRDKFVIAATAITGALLVSNVAAAYLYKLKPGQLLFRVSGLNLNITDDLMILGFMAILAAFGIYVQLNMLSGRKKN